MRDDVAKAFADGKRYFKENPDTADQLYAYAVSLAERYGWEFGGPIAGHLIDQFPHERIAEDKVTLYVHPKSNLLMRSTDDKGRRRHWILEIHFVDRGSQIGGFLRRITYHRVNAMKIRSDKSCLRMMIVGPFNLTDLHCDYGDTFWPERYTKIERRIMYRE